MKEYAEFIKEGNFSPMSVLDPELGINGEIFAKERKRGGGNISERLADTEGEDINNSSLEKVHANVSELMSKIEKNTKSTSQAYKAVYDDPFEKRHKGRRKKFSEDDDISDIFGIKNDMLTNNSANSSQSSGYQSQVEILDTQGEENLYVGETEPPTNDPNFLLGNNLLDAMTEEKHKFQSSFSTGESAIKIFIDRTNPYNKTAHPALPNVMKEMNELQLKIGNISHYRSHTQNMSACAKQSM